MIKTKEPKTTRGIRLEDKVWNELVQIAEEESKNTGKKVTPSDVVRSVCDHYLEQRKN